MKDYELMIIVNPSLQEDERTKVLETLAKTIKKHSWEITREDVWWDKKMAYKIKGSDRWFYVLYDLKIDGNEIKNISREMNLQLDIWRYMFVAK